MSPQPPPKKPQPPAAKAPNGSKKPSAATPPTPPLSESLAVTPANHYMTRKPAYVTPTATIRMAMQMMLMHKASGLPVVDDAMRCIGVYSEVDAMLQASAQHIDSKIRFSKPAKTVNMDTPLREVLIFLVKNRLKRVPVVDNQKRLCGIVTRRDVMEMFFKDYQKNNP